MSYCSNLQNTVLLRTKSIFRHFFTLFNLHFVCPPNKVMSTFHFKVIKVTFRLQHTQSKQIIENLFNYSSQINPA